MGVALSSEPRTAGVPGAVWRLQARYKTQTPTAVDGSARAAPF